MKIKPHATNSPLDVTGCAACTTVHAMHGLHLTADLFLCRCDSRWLLDAEVLRRACLTAVRHAGLHAVGQLLHTFPATSHGAGGVTATVLLAESHVCLHTWPELRGVTLDVYVCNFSSDHSHHAQAVMDSLIALFQPTTTQRNALVRGADTAPNPPLQRPLTMHHHTPTFAPMPHAPATSHPSGEPSPAPYPAMLLAAGRGERMRPLTDTTPKPLLTVQGRPLLAWHLQALGRAGVPRAIINTAWLGEQIPRFVTAAARSPHAEAQQPSIGYSHEGYDFGGALETAGGIARALPQLGPIFWLAAGDVYAPDFTFDATAAQQFANSTDLAHLWLVPNPAHHPQGDFGISATGRALNLTADDPQTRYTYSTIAVLRAQLFAPPWCDIPEGNPAGVAAALGPLLRRAMDAGRVSASLYHGRWTDVGTPERLASLNAPDNTVLTP